MSRPKYRLSPPHGDRIYWEGPRVDTRVQMVSADRKWFWRGLEENKEHESTVSEEDHG